MKIAAIIILISINLNSFSQEIDLKHVGPFNGRVYIDRIQVHPLQSEYVSICEYSGGIFYTKDGMIKNFIDLKAFEEPIVHLYPFDTQIIFAQSGSLIFKINLSENSTLLLHTNNDQLFKSHFVFNPLNPDVLYNSRDQNKIYRSDDGGNQWYLIKEFNSIIQSIAIAPSDSSILYCGVEGTIFKSTDSGNIWMKRLYNANPYSPSKILINPYNPNTIYAGYGDSICISRDGGMTLEKIMDHPTNTFVLNPQDTSIIYAVYGDLIFYPNGFVYKTTNEGASWSIINNNLPGVSVTPMMIAIDPVSPETLYVSNGDLGIFKTTNGGESWEHTRLVSMPQMSFFNYADIPGHYIVGSYGWGLLKTNDFGKNYYQPLIPGYYHSYVFRNVSENHFVEGELLSASGFTLMKSTDNGENWNDTGQLRGAWTSAYHPRIPGLLLATTREIPAVFFNDSLWRSTNNGANWDFVLEDFVRNYIFHPANDSIIYGISYGVLKSTNSGVNWEYKNNGLPQERDISSQGLVIDSQNPNVLFLGTRPISDTPGGLFISSNSGESWFRIDSTLKTLDKWLRVSSILVDKNSSGRLYVGLEKYKQPYTTDYTNGGLFLTEDYGVNWRKVFDGSVFGLYEDKATPRNIFLNTKAGLMIFSDTLSVSSIDININGISSTEYNLEQNFPNPFNPSTTFRYTIPVDGPVNISVFDVLGNLIMPVVNEEKLAGTYEIKFIASGLASGIYLVRMQTVGYISSIKIVHIK